MPRQRSREALLDPRRLFRLQELRGLVELEVEEGEGQRAFPAISLDQVRQLSPQRRMVILGIFWGHLSRQEVARVLKIDPATATKCLRRALEELRGLAAASAAPLRSSG